MKIILLRDIRSVGKKGATLDVSNGYARNFLIPRQYALPFSKDVVNKFALKDKKLDKNRSDDKRKHKQLARAISGLALRIKTSYSKQGRLFAAVKPANIVGQLQQQGINVGVEMLDPNQPIKKVGEYIIKVHLSDNNIAKFKLIIE